MSYDVSLAVKVEGLDNEWVGVTDSQNITSNVKNLIRESSGWKIDSREVIECTAEEWVSFLTTGIQALISHPEDYKHLESPNGWGTIEGTLAFFQRCLNMALELRDYNYDLFNVARVYVR